MRPCVKRRRSTCRGAGAPGQASQTLAEGGVEPFNVGGIDGAPTQQMPDHCAMVMLGQGIRRGRPISPVHRGERKACHYSATMT
jgi:hypothetical protein